MSLANDQRVIRELTLSLERMRLDIQIMAKEHSEESVNQLRILALMILHAPSGEIRVPVADFVSQDVSKKQIRRMPGEGVFIFTVEDRPAADEPPVLPLVAEPEKEQDGRSSEEFLDTLKEASKPSLRAV